MGERRLPEIKKAGRQQSRTPWGAGRIALFARIESITSDLAAGWPMTAIYQRHMAGLGISYSGFCKLVRRHANDATVSLQETRPSPSHTSASPPHRCEAAAPATAPAAATPPTVEDRQPSHAADEQPRGTFRFSPIAKEGEIDRLFGSGFFAGKK
jgi:hypothetical protein